MKRTGISHLLSKLLSMLLKLAGFPAIRRCSRRAGLADFERHVTVIRRLRSDWRSGRLLVNHSHIAPGEDALEVGTLVSTTPPWRMSQWGVLFSSSLYKTYSRCSYAPELGSDHAAAGPDRLHP